ncbi:hypothetical protein DPMN_011019 [Dreissena polymorpha]|uniref:Uncharacterized protein n=1 Tax=Dreissena polymorpha TaxID=45954 RepID=A0A9D4N3A7_DREPO|nr:hypothetical protein DPMN_011019 [Dreissena polymorpha]
MWSSGRSANAGVAKVSTRSAQSSNDSSCPCTACRNLAFDVSRSYHLVPKRDSNDFINRRNEYRSFSVVVIVKKSRDLPSKLHNR